MIIEHLVVISFVGDMAHLLFLVDSLITHCLLCHFYFYCSFRLDDWIFDCVFCILITVLSCLIAQILLDLLSIGMDYLSGSVALFCFALSLLCLIVSCFVVHLHLLTLTFLMVLPMAYVGM